MVMVRERNVVFVQHIHLIKHVSITYLDKLSIQTLAILKVD